MSPPIFQRQTSASWACSQRIARPSVGGAKKHHPQLYVSALECIIEILQMAPSRLSIACSCSCTWVCLYQGLAFHVKTCQGSQILIRHFANELAHRPLGRTGHGVRDARGKCQRTGRLTSCPYVTSLTCNSIGLSAAIALFLLSYCLWCMRSSPFIFIYNCWKFN